MINTKKINAPKTINYRDWGKRAAGSEIQKKETCKYLFGFTGNISKQKRP